MLMKILRLFKLRNVNACHFALHKKASECRKNTDFLNKRRTKMREDIENGDEEKISIVLPTPKKGILFSCPGFNFTNVLRAAFTHTDPKSAKKDG